MDATSERLRDALHEALASSSFTATSLGREIGRGPDYLRDFLNGRKASLKAGEVSAIEAALSLESGTLLAASGTSAMARSPRPESNIIRSDAIPNLKALARSRGPKVPVLGIAVGGEDGDFSFNGETVNWLPRPASIADAKDVYGLFVSNDSMRPLFKGGDPIYVDPHRTPSIGDCVVIELKPNDDGSPGPGFLKELVRRSATNLTVEQYNPAKELSFQTREVKAIHRVIPWRELLGL